LGPRPKKLAAGSKSPEGTSAESSCGKAIPVVADGTTTEGQAKLLEACPARDILVNSNAGPNPGNFLDFPQRTWFKALDANMIAPLMLIDASAIPGGLVRLARFCVAR
jgi:hypothetical protein